MIWEHALSEWTVLAPGHHCDCGAPTLTAVGPAPYLAGLACAESRRLLSQSYAKFTFRHKSECDVSGDYWINKDRTVLCLGVSPHADELLRVFNADALLYFQHVVLRWNIDFVSPWSRWKIDSPGPVSRALVLLDTRRSALESVVIQTAEETKGGAKGGAVGKGPWFNQSMSVSTAGYYSIVPDYDRPELAGRVARALLFGEYQVMVFMSTIPKGRIVPA